ncbi:MAG: hypothetical protein M1816_005575 [Peltula sp. TS41687]|nr:MAG: hypothetical protein M1816_005575 [Peltula sp. TS41687]
MSTPNGVLSPPLPQNEILPTPSTKRKRTGDGPDDRTDETKKRSRNDREQGHGDTTPTASFFLDMLAIMRSRDTTPSILHMPFEPSKGTSIEPATKRQRTDDSEKAMTIASKISSGAYTTYQSLADDVNQAASYVLELLAQYALRPDHEGPNSLLLSSTAHRQAAVEDVLAFKRFIVSLILREKLQNRLLPTMEQGGEISSNINKIATGNLVEETQRGSLTQQTAPHAHVNRCVLTLYGSAPQPKQLFSSLQKPVSISRENDASATTSPSSVEVFLPIPRSSLPAGILTTTVVPTHGPSLVEKPKRKVPTFGEVFAPPPNLPQLQPPKPSKYTTTRGMMVNFYNPADHMTDSRSNLRSWATHPSSTGEWLSYGGMPSVQQPSSPEAKRRKRERALSTGEQEAEMAVPPEWIEIQNHARAEARAEALFRRNYSSFAPTRDDTGAVVPAEIKAQVWWNRLGRERHQQYMDSAEPTAQNTSDQTSEVQGSTTAPEPVDDEEASFREAVENWRPESQSADFVEYQPGDGVKIAEKSLDEVLQETSQLIETLNSYQQARNHSLTSLSSHSTIPQVASIIELVGTPSSPSAAEKELADKIKKRLAAQIDQLAPYEVVKVDGDQLGKLNVSTKRLVPGEDYRGVMEEEEIIPRSMAGVVGTGVSPGSSVRAAPMGVPYGATPPGTYSSRPKYGAQMTGSPRPTTQIRPQGSGQYYPQKTPTGGSRGGAMNTLHNASGTMGPPQAGPSPHSTPSRAPYGGQTNPQQYFQNQSSVGHNPHYPPPATTTPYQRPTQPQYQQHAQQRKHPIVYGGGSAARNASNAYAGRVATAKASQQAPNTYSPSPLATPTPAPNHPYASAPAATPAPRAYLPAYSQATTMQQPSSNVGVSGFHTYMTPEDQAKMMEKQRAQLAAQQQQIQIQNAAVIANQRAMQANMLASVSSSSATPTTTGAGATVNTQVQNAAGGNAATPQMIAQPVQIPTQNQNQHTTQQVNHARVIGGETGAGSGSFSGGNTVSGQMPDTRSTEHQTTAQAQGRSQGQGETESVPVAMTTGTTTLEAATGMGGNDATSNPIPAAVVGGGSERN